MRDQKQQTPAPTRHTIRKIAIGLTWCLVLSISACVWDPSGALHGKKPNGPERGAMQMLKETPLQEDAHALFIKGDRAFICTLNNKKSAINTPLFSITAFDLESLQAVWTTKDAFCFFDADESHVFLVKEAPTNKQIRLLEQLDIKTGKLVKSTKLEGFPAALGLRGPGRAVHEALPPTAPWFGTKIQATGEYLLVRTHANAWVFKRDNMRLLYQKGAPIPSEKRQDVFDATISNDTLYIVARDTIHGAVATQLDPLTTAIPGVLDQHLLSAIDLTTNKLLWQKKDLASPLQRAQIETSASHLMLQLNVPFTTQHEPDYKHIQTSRSNSNQKTETSLHYWLARRDGAKAWSKPRVILNEFSNENLAPPVIVKLTEQRLFVHVEKSLYAFSITGTAQNWVRQTVLTTPGIIAPHQQATLLYQNTRATMLINEKNGADIDLWETRILPPPSKIASDDSSDNGGIVAAKPVCILADGSKRRVLVSPATPPYYEHSNQNGFYNTFCVKNYLLLKKENAQKALEWTSTTELEQGEPEFIFRYKNTIITIANKLTLLAYRFPQ